MYVTTILADYASSPQPASLTAATIEMVKRCLLDLVGSAAAGFDSDAAKAARAALSKIFPGRVRRPGRDGSARRLVRTPSLLWFTDREFPAPVAALMNSAAASALDLDDGQRAAGGHPGASVIPAALAVAEEVQATAQEFLTAVVIGYEVGTRVAAARDFDALDTLSTGRWCAYGAAAAGGFLRRMPPNKLAQALATAGVLAPGLSAAGYSSVMGNQVKEGIPWSTFTGLLALDLADEGLTGPTDILDHPSYYDRDKIVEGLGKGFAIENVYFKPYSCCRWSHSALDALLQLMVEHGIAVGEIRGVQVHTFGRALRLNNAVAPESLEAAQYSVPFALAAAAIGGEQALLPMRSGRLGCPELVEFARKVELHVDPDLDRAFPAKAAARVVLQTGRGDFERLVTDALGDPANPFDRPRLEAKFRILSRGVLSAREQDEMIDAITGLDAGGYGRFVELLQRSRTPGR